MSVLMADYLQNMDDSRVAQKIPENILLFFLGNH
jgi:hypothetical protein